MFRGPQILALTCPIRTPRPLLLGVRDPCVSASPGAPSPRRQGVRARRGSSACQGNRGMRGGEESVSLHSAISSQNPVCGGSPLNTSPQNSTPKAAPSSSLLHQPQEDSRLISVNGWPGWSGAWLAFKPWEDSLLEHLEQSCGAVHRRPDGSKDINCLQQRRRPMDSSPPPPTPRPAVTSIESKLHSPSQGRPFCTRSSPRLLLGPSVPQPWTLDLQRARLSSARPPSLALSLPQTRGVHQAALPREAALRECLSPENQQRCCRKLGANLGLYDGEQAGRGAQGRWASVLVSLCSVEGEPAFLFTLRSSTLKGRHKGDVSFPGGKRDPMDRDVVDTALREAREELGVTVATESVWGVLKPLRDMSGMMIAPVLANLGPLEALSFRPNPGEVEEVFTLSLSHVCSPENTGYTHFRTGSRYGYTLPVFRNGKHRVWGLTAVALDHTLKLILPSWQPLSLR